MNYALTNGIINMEYVQKEIEMRERKEYLKKHTHSIWEGKNGKWYTYLPDDSKPNSRVLRKRNSKKEIEDLIVDYWKELDSTPTVKALYEEWITRKVERKDIQLSTKNRYDRQFKQCFSCIENLKINTITEYDIEEFVLNAICEEKLTQKGFANMRTIIYGIFKLAKRKKQIDFNISEVISGLDISKKAFRKKIVSDEMQVFSREEEHLITDYLSTNLDITNLGILLMFKTGLRVGELSALKKCDIINYNCIKVHRTEIRYEKSDGAAIYEVRDFPKTEAGIRDVFLPDSCEWIIKKIIHLNPFSNFLFEKNGERMLAHMFRNRLRTICKRLDIISKSPHKIRKTYGTMLLDNGIEESIICSQMGHTSIKTTRNYYYKDRNTPEEKIETLNSVSNL